MSDWTPAFRGQRPPFEKGNPGGPPPTTHGAHSENELAPLREQIEERLAANSPEYAAADDYARRQLANQLARCELVHQWLNANGMIDEKGRPWPVLAELVKWENSARSMMRDLGMTTTSRVELELDRLQATREMVSLAELQEALRDALALALDYIPKDRRAHYMQQVRALLGATATAEDLPAIEGRRDP